jgi:hypothetical protein
MKTVFEQEGPVLARLCGMHERTIPLAKLAYLLVLGWWLHPQAGQSALARFAGSLGLHLCKQDVDCHFTERTATWLLALLQEAIKHLVCAHPVAVPLLQQWKAVYVEDASTISLPSALRSLWCGSGGSPVTRGHDAKNEAALKLCVRWDLLAGGMQGPYLQAGRSHEAKGVLREIPMAEQSLWLGDQGYWGLPWLRTLIQEGVDFLMRYKDGTTLWKDQQPTDVFDLLPQEVGSRLEWQVDLGAEHPITGVRLLCERVPDAVAKQRQERLRKEAQDHAKTVSARQMALASWTILVTNVPIHMLTHAQALILMRARWQIELLFKLWKQHGLLDSWSGTKSWRVLCEVYAKLVAVVVQHWFVLLSCWDDPHRSLPAVVHTLRDQVPVLVHGLMKRLPLRRAVRLMLESVSPACSIPARSTRPSTSRLLLGALEPGLT